MDFSASVAQLVYATEVFPWDALATFIAGLMAVFAAWKIGKLQLRILERQTVVAENDLKIQLFDMRSKCLRKLRKLNAKRVRESRLEVDSIVKLQELMIEAQTLFPRETVNMFEATFTEVFEAHRKYTRSNDYYRRGNDERAEQFRDEAWEHEDKVFDLFPSLLEELKNQTRPDVWDKAVK